MTTEPTPRPLDLAALTEIAKAATPGPWEAFTFPGEKGTAPYAAVEVGDHEVQLPWLDGSYLTARHIAAFDPPTVLALIARVERAEGAGRFHDSCRENWQARAERAESVYERVEQQALGAEANLEAALKVSRERLARAEAAEAKVAAVRELRNEWFREIDSPDHLVPLDDVISATDTALRGNAG